MNIAEGLKVAVLGVFLVAIASLPALTATQLVSVLGTTSARTELMLTPLGDQSTFLKQSGNTLTVSFLRPGEHRLLRIDNPTSLVRSFQIQLGSLSTTQTNLTVNLVNGTTQYPLFKSGPTPVRSSYILAVPSNASLNLNLEILPNTDEFGTFNLTVTEI